MFLLDVCQISFLRSKIDWNFIKCAGYKDWAVRTPAETQKGTEWDL